MRHTAVTVECLIIETQLLDEYSRFPEVEIVKSLSAQTVIPIFDKVFSSMGIPENLKTDNGTPFQSSAFRNFANDLGFQHQRITPYWPEANGVTERFMRTIGKVCKCAQVDGKSWKQELYRFLRNYRATPHTSTVRPPATVLNGVPLKTKNCHKCLIHKMTNSFARKIRVRRTT